MHRYRSSVRRWHYSWRAILLSIGIISWLILGTQSIWADKAKEGHKKAQKLLERASAQMAKGKILDAEMTLQKAVQADPKWVEVYVAQGKCYDKMNNHINALISWKKAVKIQPNSLTYKRAMARSAVNALEWEDAIEAWKDIANRCPDDIEARRALGTAYLACDNVEEAQVYINEALDLNISDARANILKAKLEVVQGDYGDAIKRLNEVMSDLPADHPLLADCISCLDDVTIKQRDYRVFIFVLITIPAIILVIALVSLRHIKKVASPKEPVLELEGATEDSVCRFLLDYSIFKLDMPRALCWSTNIDGRHMDLNVSQLVGETSEVSHIPIDMKAVDIWLAKRGTAPFMYQPELESDDFKKAFSVLINKLSEVYITAGIPVVANGKLTALVLLGSSRSVKTDKILSRFCAVSESIQEVVQSAAEALERIKQKNMRVIDSKTGLWNRNYLEECLPSMYRGCRAANISLGVFMMRMDQVPAMLEQISEEEAGELLYKVGQLLVRGLSGEMDITFCHLDNGVFSMLVPGLSAREAELLAQKVKSCFEKSTLAGPDVRTTGCVAYAIAPEDGDDPQTLRALLARCFHELIFQNGNAIKRVSKVSQAVEEEEKPQEEELIIRRSHRAPSDKKNTYQPFGKARITSNADNEAIKENSQAIKAISAKKESSVVTLGIVSRPNEAARSKIGGSTELANRLKEQNKEASKASSLKMSGVPIKHRLVDDTIEPISNSASSKNNSAKNLSALNVEAKPASSTLDIQEPSKVTAPKVSDEPSKVSSEVSAKPVDSANDVDYKLNLKFDDDGVEIDTQCCSQEIFEELIGFELEQAYDSGEDCALIYLHLENYKELRAKGRDNYLEMRRNLADLTRSFLREDIDIPGLVGEDDFAFFMPEASTLQAAGLADHIDPTVRTIDIKGCAVIPAIGVVTIAADSNFNSKSLLAKAKALAFGAGIHYSEDL